MNLRVKRKLLNRDEQYVSAMCRMCNRIDERDAEFPLSFISSEPPRSEDATQDEIDRVPSSDVVKKIASNHAKKTGHLVLFIVNTDMRYTLSI